MKGATLRTTFWTFIGSFYVMALVCAAAVGLRFDLAEAVWMLLPCAACFLFLEFQCRKPHLSKWRAYGDVAFGGVALTFPGLLASYAAARLGMPLADDTLVAMDAALGVDWTAFIRWVDANAALAHVLGCAYQSFAPQLLLIPLLLIRVGKARSAYVFVAAFGLVAAVSSAVSAWFPALGTYPVYGIDPATLANINAHYGYFFLEQFSAVRDDPDFVLAPSRAAGIITFPSCHAGAAALCAWAAFKLPGLRVGLVPLNAAMAASAVTHANHYVVDVIAGVLIAALSIYAARLAFPTARDGEGAEAHALP